MKRAARPMMLLTSTFSDGQPVVENAFMPWYSSTCVDFRFGTVPGPRSSWISAFGSSAPWPMMPRGRPYLKLRPIMRTPLASSADAKVSPA